MRQQRERFFEAIRPLQFACQGVGEQVLRRVTGWAGVCLVAAWEQPAAIAVLRAWSRDETRRASTDGAAWRSPDIVKSWICGPIR